MGGELERAGGAVQDRRLQGAAARQGDHQGRAGGDRGVVVAGLGGGGDRGDEQGVGQPGLHQGRAQEAAAVRAPVRGVGHRDPVRGGALDGGDGVDHPGGDRGDQGLGRVELAAQQHGGVVADPVQRVPGQPVGLGGRAAQGGPAQDHVAVAADEQHGREPGGATVDGDDLGRGVAVRGAPADRRHTARAAHVDPEHVGQCDSVRRRRRWADGVGPGG
ncbi:hypothetical protein ACOBQX_12135 [Actinokineospora sp. G85]|uniref:hypothetical protein n=1 Tax=Actinokineospora sp. G85 TaxID=3406626 RepID=UPI003C752858